MEEDDCDYGTPIGKVIKHINALCKKPQVDDQLSEALDLFNEKLEDQEKYLINGIFKTNFTEAALFIQSSTELYGKKIDVLWDQLLEFHTRLIKYECEHQKEKGLSLNKEVIEKLEERRNRYKRRKKFKLILQASEAQKIDILIFDKEKENKTVATNDEDEADERRRWRNLECKSREMRKIPNIVYKQMTQQYMLKNYHVLKCQDFEIWDPEDGEFNTRYSRIPGWHHTEHTFEYNDKGLLPDKNNIIARLRLTAYGRIRFLASRGIPFNTPFEEYKEEYMCYRLKFFEEEAKRWQNMPLDTLEDLRKQLQYLVQKEREENGEAATGYETDKLGRYGVKCISQQSLSDKIEILDNSDEDSLFELSFSCDKNFMKSDLFIRLEKLSSELINTKLRQDSGFYDFNSDSDNDCDVTLSDITLEPSNKDGGDAATTIDRDNTNINKETKDDTIVEKENDTYKDPVEGDRDNTNVNKEAKDDTIMEKEDNTYTDPVEGDSTHVINQQGKDDTVADKESICKDAVDENKMNEHNYADTSKTCVVNDTDENHDNFETRSFISDHDYCFTSPPTLDPIENNSENNNLQSGIKSSLNKTVEETFTKPFCNAVRIVPKIIKIVQRKEKKQAIKETNDGESPPKRRKLTQKQFDKLVQSKIKPVKQMKFEKFFSMNYQPQLGEENLDGDFLPHENHAEANLPDGNLIDDNYVNENHTDDNQSVHSEHSDIRSIHSDHDYCQPAAENSHNDSGFLEASNSQSSTEGETLGEIAQKDQQENNCGEKQVSQSIAGEDSVISLEDEYERLLALLNESKQTKDKKETVNDGRCSPTERELQEKELEKSRARVEEWRNTINPILRNLKECDFDIHEYGSKIMEGMEINGSKLFSDMVQGKSSAEVVRYFISSLQLANTCNIEICGAKQGQLSNDTYKVKLLTKDRYHEHLNEYLAPSEETLREKLDRVRKMTANKCKVIINSIAQEHNNSNVGCSQEKYNNTEITHQQRLLSKGKSIIKKQSNSNRSQEPYILNADISMPSTSRHVHWSDSPTCRYSSYARPDINTPSTSFQRFSPSPDVLETRLSHDIHDPSTSFDGVSPNKRRRESTEESFVERLVSVQEMNPDVQLQSTPNTLLPSKQMRTSLSLKRSLLFE
ncbi:hypothetical protein NQ314_007701 [Rhamnusium bicolor]|uniref:Condensin-2 complex subunit H2 C-terminal domain-containing protein n=1 Tax=Rhamnusium bicolor TaxID=1586634 RepID=A0AAV8YKJ6_9CUCU|nr:hypothetical protein NQ314_007701 [Rhamnusium bicolor]